MNPTLKTGLHGLRDNVLPMMSLTRYHGKEGSMLLAGEERWSRYLRSRFFAGETEQEPLGSFRTWQLPAALRKHRHGMRTRGSGTLRHISWSRFCAPP